MVEGKSMEPGANLIFLIEVSEAVSLCTDATHKNLPAAQWVMDGTSLHFTMYTSHPVGSDSEPKGHEKQC